jgi:hypothetical protein
VAFTGSWKSINIELWDNVKEMFGKKKPEGS